MTHTSDTRQGCRTNRSATASRKVRTFNSSAYLEELMAELDRAAISLRLAQARDESGLTQEELADVLGIHFRSVQNYESPKERRLPWDLLDEWARATGTTKEWLLHGREQPAEGVDRAQLEDLVARLARLVALLEQERAVARAD